ncbi:MAG: SUMF1/EgtB/PvdO family nonheme iron enzyme [Desulfobacterales bacterium]|nr:SUMF1/EgtB/PvdO family nonheme iron enzyme [Desulfobacterales bacterium]
MVEPAPKESFADCLTKAANFFRRTRGSGLLFCVSDNTRLVEEVNQRLVAFVGNTSRTMSLLNLGSDNRTDYIQAIKVAAGSSPGGLIVNRFDRVIDVTDGEAIRGLNYAREVLMDLDLPLLFWLSENNHAALSRGAPDLYLRRSRSSIFFPTDDAITSELSALEAALVAQERLKDSLPPGVLETTLAALRARCDELVRLRADLAGSGAVAQGEGAVAAGQGGVALGGDASGNIIITGDHAQIRTGLSNASARSREDILQRYREFLLAGHRFMVMRGIELSASDPGSGRSQMDLFRVYIDMDTTGTRETDRHPGAEKQDDREQEPKPLTALAAVAENRQAVLLGDPGLGKSTLVNYLTFCLAQHGLDPQGGWLKRIVPWPEAEADVVPIPVVLRDLLRRLPEDACNPTSRVLWDHLREWLKDNQLGSAAALLKKALEKGNAVVLLDGLDEIPTQAQVCFVRDTVEAFARTYPKARMIVTCRVLAYRQDPNAQLHDVPVFELAPFDEKRIDAFVDAWYSELLRLRQIKTPEEARDVAARLKAAVRRSDIRQLAPNPLLLTVMAQVHTHMGLLPDTRARLYEEAVEILLVRWDQLKARQEKSQPRLKELLIAAGRSEVDLKTRLRRLAFEAHRAGDEAGATTLADIREYDLQQAIAGLHPEKSLDWAHQVINTLKLRAGLLLERRPGVYTFPHRTFQEYLAGSHLSIQPDFSRQASALAARGAYWREAVLLAVGRLVHVAEDLDKPLALAAELCPEDIEDTDAGWRKAWLAGDVLLEIGLNRLNDSALGRDLARRVPGRLAGLLQQGRLAPRERAAAGTSLARLGDPRFSPETWFLPVEPTLGFVKIPSGEFLMGSDDSDKRAGKDEKPRHPVELPEFYMARYPVTVAQFRAFVQDSGYDVKGPWQKFSGADNHPVVAVTWHDARAYCQWLTDRLRESTDTSEPLAGLLRNSGWEARLPSEAQWEKAARGGDGRIYPWGNDSDPDRANYDDTGIGGTSQVGSFPKGESLYGCLDMAGNVWEWTRSLWGKDLFNPTFGYPYDPNDSMREDESADDKMRRVLRGGAFNYAVNGVRCAARDRFSPGGRSGGGGFRVVVSSGLL